MPNKLNEELKPKMFLSALHHSDLTWQYSYERYDEIREEQINIILDFFKHNPEFHFVFDQAHVVQNYLERNPQRFEIFKKLIDNGNGPMELIGWTSIPDLNLCSGESLIRNIIAGKKYYEDTFNVTADIGSLMDAFGMSSQIPQILSKLGYKYLLPGRMPNVDASLDQSKPFIWKGQDGSIVIMAPPNATVGKSGYTTNVPVIYNHEERFRNTLSDLQKMEGDVFGLYFTERENLDEDFFKYIEELNKNDEKGKHQITFGRVADYCKRIDVEGLPVFSGEFNPTFTGCYTTRIGVKQEARKTENILFAGELAAALAGMQADFNPFWNELSLAQFHDAICGCHNDEPNNDVMQKLSFATHGAKALCDKAMEALSDDGLTVVNTAGSKNPQLIATDLKHLPKGTAVQQDGDNVLFVAELPAYGIVHLKIGTPSDTRVIVLENPIGYKLTTDCFFADFSEVFPKITSRRHSNNVFGQQNFGEIIFRHENGSMWSEKIMEVPLGEEYQEESVLRVEEGPVFIKVITHGRVVPGREPESGNFGDYWTGFGSLSFTKEYIFPRHLEHFRLHLTLDFSGNNTKVSLRIPVELNPLEAVALYDTPFAAVNRRPYFEVLAQYKESMKPLCSPSYYANATGDWPTLQWVDYSDKNVGLAVANTGTPGHQLVNKDILISLLRSGTHCSDGSMYPQPGAFDNGTHVYDFAFADHLPNEVDKAAQLAAELNRNPVCSFGKSGATKSNCAILTDGGSLISFDKNNLAVSSIYNEGDNLILRAYEVFGNATIAALTFSDSYKLYSADFTGIADKKISSESISFNPYEIRTFRLVRG